MVKPFVEMNLGLIKSGIEKTKQGFEAGKEKAIGALSQAMGEYSEDTLSEAQSKAPVGKTGDLKASGTTLGPERQGEAIVCLVSFNKIYARIQDLGGDIKPVRAKALFIPLRDNVRPGQPGLIFGIDFVLAKKVTLKGNRYLTGTIEGRVPTATELLGRRVTQLMEVPA